MRLLVPGPEPRIRDYRAATATSNLVSTTTLPLARFHDVLGRSGFAAYPNPLDHRARLGLSHTAPAWWKQKRSAAAEGGRHDASPEKREVADAPRASPADPTG